MQFIEPKERLKQKTDWRISDQTKSIVKHYAEYTGYSEDEVVDMFLKNILEDESFLNWVQTKRRNKRIIEQLGLNGEDICQN
ncbi:hypothetical protein [Thalassobacillus hwangdonensis]|uniref:Histidine kinase n=1 Tax=Thalassobacillus hwangdonensis TaxID=546108 RepID=A0ABW3L812_9BACI